MIVIKDKVENKIEYPLERLGNVDHMIYFDIETTGFSRKYCMVYMIGCMYFVNSEPIYTQWVAENANDEANVLMAFHKFIQNYKIIIHFNGNTFDMPFLKERGEKYNINFDFDSFESIDIYKTVKKYSDLLKLENNKQKTYEDFLGIKRKYLAGPTLSIVLTVASAVQSNVLVSLQFTPSKLVENSICVTVPFPASSLG